MPPRLSYKHSPQVAWRKVDDTIVVLDLNSSLYYSFNETAAWIWEQLESKKDAAWLADKLGKEYSLPAAKALKDSEDFLKSLCKEKLIVAA